jgi:type IV secretory pathway protease TraF
MGVENNRDTEFSAWMDYLSMVERELRLVSVLLDQGYQILRPGDPTQPGEIVVPVLIPHPFTYLRESTPLMPKIRALPSKPINHIQHMFPGKEFGPSAVEGAHGVERPVFTMLFDLQVED